MCNKIIHLRVLQQDTCDQIRIGASFPVWDSKLDLLVENTKKQYIEESPSFKSFEELCERYYRRIALVDADSLKSVRELWSKKH